MIRQLDKNLFLIPITLPNNPLKFINTYLIRGERDLLIDTGFNNDICEAEMLESFDILQVDQKRLDIFVTHFHSDHVGLANRLLTPLSRFYCNYEIESIVNECNNKISNKSFRTPGWSFESWGVQTADYSLQMPQELDVGFTSIPENTRYLHDNDKISYGGHDFYYIKTPGHMFDHGCLYEPHKKWLFCGDLILDHITPAISSYCFDDDDLQMYIQSLEKIATYPNIKAYSGHYATITDCGQRILEIIGHHHKRLSEVEEILSGKFLTVAQVAENMRWHIKDHQWNRMQKYFTMGEAMAHLAYLYQNNRANVKTCNNVLYFSRDS